MGSSNGIPSDLKATLLPVMKALLKVMETNRPAPKDINNLLILTRELTKDGNVGFGSGFGSLDGIQEVLPPTGDIIVSLNGIPHIKTQWGKSH